MSRAIVVFPHSGLQGALTDRHRRWLSRGRVTAKPHATEPLNDVLLELRLPVLTSGFAALRFQGQTGRETVSWIAAADPISFEPRLRDIVARRIPRQQLADSDLRALVASAQVLFADEHAMQLECNGNLGYLQSDNAMPTSQISPTTLHGFGPDGYLPAGARGRPFQRLHSELQMLFHDHPVNRRRAEQGLTPVNGLWIWGGGELPDRAQQSLPVLYSDDPLFRGYWKHFGGDVSPWPGSMGNCVSAANGDFVVTVPEADSGIFDETALGLLDEVSGLLKNRRVTHLALIFNNEVHAELRWSDRLKFWRRPSVLNPGTGHNV